MEVVASERGIRAGWVFLSRLCCQSDMGWAKSTKVFHMELLKHLCGFCKNHAWFQYACVEANQTGVPPALPGWQ